MVSEDDWIIEAAIPIGESGFILFNILFRYNKLLLPDTGRRRASGSISLGMCKYDNTGDIFVLISNNILLFVKVLIAKVIANIVGNNSKDRVKPSFTPFKNKLYTSTFLYSPYETTTNIINGIIRFEIF